ncbi:glycosyltransferase [Mycobacterium phage Phrappuccino]|uniref:Glycosyltransferase n=1 Tax=Mycobacterium phage Phrappuccino TaxID=2591223 RepID=A0A514DDZ6_9CAUD|nr:glycosyltransferase [Mycobacterium phage Phrappuccino]QDH91817.1 glycosyltransferase [Mycobacterium phage Phrappuccino]QIQ63259.1 glycosyltransferase [Mycobacterium phage Settecandela]
MAECIPRRLIRTVPEQLDDEAERLWTIATELHPDWEHVTLRDPIDRSLFPITSPHWDACETGAQLADLVRAEELYWRGGVYIDSDVECYRSFDPLLGVQGFAAWEDSDHIPNAVMGFTPWHPAIRAVVDLAVARQGEGTWAAGVGVTTEVFAGRDDMLLLPPASFYPYHYTMKTVAQPEMIQRQNPWAFCAHHWKHSWA